MPLSARTPKGALRWLPPALVAVATLAAFSLAVKNGFVDWDDQSNYVDNPRFRGLAWNNLRWMFTTFHSAHYQPLTWLSLGLDFKLWGMNPAGYHLTSAVLHALNAVVFYFLARRLLALAAPAAPERPLSLALGAGLAALLFGVHPMRVESVVWLSERRDVLSGLFYLSAVLLYVRGDRARSIGCFVLSLLSKVVGLTLPVVLVLLDVYPLKRLAADPRRWFAKAYRAVWIEKIPYLACSIAFAALNLAAQSRAGLLATVEQRSLLTRAVMSVYGISFYLWKTVWPAGLIPLYQAPARMALFSWPVLSSAGLVAVLTAGFVLSRRRFPAGLAAWVYYLVTLFPMSGAFITGPQIVADRYSYLPCLGWALLAGGGLHALSRPRGAQGRLAARLGAAAAGGVILALGGLTLKQTRIWRSSEALWSHTLAFEPDTPLAHNNLGAILQSQGKLAEAAGHYRRSIELDPAYAKPRANLCLILAAEGRLDEAMSYCRQALKIDPREAPTYNILGGLLIRQGRLEEALASFQRAVELDPGFLAADVNMGIILTHQGKLQEALERYRRALKVNPGYRPALANAMELEAILRQQGRRVTP